MEGHNENLLFITRANKLQLYDFNAEAVKKEYEFSQKMGILDINSGFSPSKKFYYVS